MKKYEDILPNDYKEAKVIDAKKKSTAIIFNLGALIIMMVVIAIGLLLYPYELSIDFSPRTSLFLLGLLGAMIIYIVLHELTHGLVYKIFTKQKLTFGITFSCAFCGVPNIYVYRKVAMFAIIAPFVLFTIVFGIPLFFIKDSLIYSLTLLMFAIHVSGCIGDLYGFSLFLFKYRKKDTLMNDTGPKQTFYLNKE